MKYRDNVIEQLRRKTKRQETALEITREHLKEMEDLRELARQQEGK